VEKKCALLQSLNISGAAKRVTFAAFRITIAERHISAFVDPNCDTVQEVSAKAESIY
jgi:hypothetical protein